MLYVLYQTCIPWIVVWSFLHLLLVLKEHKDFQFVTLKNVFGFFPLCFIVDSVYTVFKTMNGANNLLPSFFQYWISNRIKSQDLWTFFLKNGWNWSQHLCHELSWFIFQYANDNENKNSSKYLSKSIEYINYENTKPKYDSNDINLNHFRILVNLWKW